MSVATPTAPPPVAPPASSELTSAGRWMVLIVGLLGWLFCGVHMAITPLAGQVAALALLGETGAIDLPQYQAWNKATQQLKSDKSKLADFKDSAAGRQFESWSALATRWFAWYSCAFLFGAAGGGLIFGWVGDRFGRARGMATSILMYSGMAGVASFAQSPEQLLVAWFLACLGVGGMWPNGVALVSEAWAGLSRPFVAGMIGVAANVGLFGMNALAALPDYVVTVDSWRWMLHLASAPFVLGIVAWLFVPESPKWLALQGKHCESESKPVTMVEVFRGPLLGTTILGIALATIPMMGGWGSATWMLPWAGSVGEAAEPPRPELKAQVGKYRALTGMVGSLAGGWIAGLLGRRLTFFLVSLAALLIAQYTYWFLDPLNKMFLPMAGALGFFSGIYYGWLPLCLPELFPTRSRSTGAGVSFNFGRIATAVTLLITGALMTYFKSDYAQLGRATSLIFALGMVVILFAPDTSKRELAD